MRWRCGERGTPIRGVPTASGPMRVRWNLLRLDMCDLLIVVLTWLLLTWDEVASGHWLLSSCDGDRTGAHRVARTVRVRCHLVSLDIWSPWG